LTLIRFYKPYGVLSQFTDRGGARPTLADYVDVPGVYPAGRLDRDSEGLLLLTDDGALQARIAHPRFKLEKVYWAQVEAQPDEAALEAARQALAAGVPLKDGPARAEALRPLAPPDLPSRAEPVTPHRAARSSWLEVTLTEGRNRQVRRMLAAVGMPVLRLHRARIGPVTLEGLRPGEYQRIETPAALADDALRRPRNPRRWSAGGRRR
jgi:23S rRNA pseudouridine2457 synthase